MSFLSDGICLSLLKNLSKSWSASITLKQFALAIQELLCNPSKKRLLKCVDRTINCTKERIREQTKKYKAEEEIHLSSDYS
jgi:ubiquitin-protein ligase